MSPEAEGPRVGRVYFLIMRDGSRPEFDFGRVKVGITWGDVPTRVASLQTGNPYDLRCFDTFETPWPNGVENFVHRLHAADMFRNEWMRCTRNFLPNLVDEAKAAALRIGARKAKEERYAGHPSNGEFRPVTSEDRRLHRDAQELTAKLVPARLRLEIAENRLKSATGTTFGISGIIRVTLVPARPRFSATLAESLFPLLARQCIVDKIAGVFRWSKLPRRSDFAAESELADAALEAASRSARAVAERRVARLDGWTDRTPMFEEWHDDFLQAMQAVNQLEAELADVRSEMIVGLEEFDGVEGVCSFRRRSVPKFDGALFKQQFPCDAAQCVVESCTGGPRKSIYPARSYLATPEFGGERDVLCFVQCGIVQAV
jgi:hypothetical protein